MIKPGKTALILLLSILFCVSISFGQDPVLGIVTDEISTKEGVIKLTRTKHLPKGKSISGRVSIEPESDKEKKKAKQLENLSQLVLKFGDEVIPNQGLFNIILPRQLNTQLQLLTKDGTILKNISLELNEPFELSGVDLPQTLISGRTERITGAITESLDQIDLKLDNNPIEILASNNSEIFFSTPSVESGEHKLTLRTNRIEIDKDVSIVDYSLQVGKTNYLK